MKLTPFLYLLLIITFSISGCINASPLAIPTQTKSRITTPVVFPSANNSIPASTNTLTPTPQIPTAALTPPIPLGSEEAMATIQALLREPVDCAAPCFWGITPERTTLGEAENIFARLGLQMWHITAEGGQFSGIKHDFLSLSINLTVQESTVKNLRVKIVPEEQRAGFPREWLAYSPETLINRYGAPSDVLIKLEWGPRSFFDMIIHYDEFDLIVEYAGHDIIPRTIGSPEVCPLTAQFEMVWLWMGKDPIYPPLPGVSVEKATDMTLEEFSKLMTGDPDKACFIVKAEEFIP